MQMIIRSPQISSTVHIYIYKDLAMREVRGVVSWFTRRSERIDRRSVVMGAPVNVPTRKRQATE